MSEMDVMISMKLSSIAFLNIKNVDYCCISRISKSEAINLMQNTNVTEKKQIIIKYENLLGVI